MANNTDIYPNDGNFFQPEVPDDVKKAEQEARQQERQSIPVVEDLIAWFDAQIVEAEKLSNIDTESTVPIESQVKALQELVRLLELKKGELQVIEFKYKRD